MGFITSLCHTLGLLFFISASRGQAVEWLGRPKSVSAREGENITFVCRLSAADPSIIWVKGEGDAILFTKDDRFEADIRFSIINKYDLVISNIKKEDNGVYACRTKDAGIQTATLTVLLYPGPPSITRDDQGPVYTEGDIVNLTCSSTGGNPNPRVTWLKNGNISTAIPAIKEATTVGGTTSSTISLTMDKTDHQANYSCLLYNDLNVNNKLVDAVVLSVKYSPTIAFQPYSPVYTVKMGGNVEIVCDVDANPLVTSVTWSKDGISLAGTSPKRTLSQVSKADHGKYNCTARNSVGERSGTLEVNVEYAPIINIPFTLTANEGGNVTLKCDMTANPTPYEVQWLKVLVDGSFQTVVNADTLRIPVVNRADAGNYSCRAQSQLRVSGRSVEFVSSQAFTYINVQYKPGKASIDPVTDIDTGERLDITCKANPAGYPEATYAWAKDGKVLPQNKSTFTVASASLSDNGRYSCTPSNSRGAGEPAYVDVHVYETPKVIKAPTAELSVYLTEPQLISLTCEVTGYPQPRVTWYQDGENQPLNLMTDLFTVVMTTSPQGSYSIKVQSTLQFKGSGRAANPSGQKIALQIRDMGNYSCQAESDKHTDIPTTVTQLFINFAPVLEDTASRVAVSRLDTAELVCAAQAHPNPTFQWFFQRQQLLPGQTGVTITQEPLGSRGKMQSKLTIKSVSDRSYGLYKCVVLNGLGNVTKDITLSVKSPPEKPTQLASSSQTWESVLLTWLPGFDGGYDQSFYIQVSGGKENPKRIDVTPSSSRTFNLTKLRPSNTYTFQVVAKNELGLGPASQLLTVTTNNLQIPNLPKTPMFDAHLRKLVVLAPFPYDNDYCLKVEVKSEVGEWSPINGCMKVMGDTLEIAHTGVNAINISVCLSHRTDVCGVPVAAEIHSNDKEAVLTEEHVIIIACVCGIIIVTLLIVLFCFIFRRRRNAAKNYQGENQGDPPPYNAVPPNKKPQVYDNQDGPLDLYVPPRSSPHPPGVPSRIVLSDAYRQRRPISPRPRVEAPRIDTHLYDNELNQRNENNRMDSYPNRDNQPVTGVPRSPTKDKYIDLQDRGGGGDVMGGPEAGYNANDPSAPSSKPKKRLKWSWHWKEKESAPPPPPNFSHNPPGHTCGLPCCNHDNELPPVAPPPTQRGCVQVPVTFPVELSESNFFMKKKSPSALIGKDITALGLERRSTGESDTGERMEIDKDGNRAINFTGGRSGFEDFARGLSSIRQRRGKLAPWETLRRRCITLPDTSASPHRMMFLNYQPGETSDYGETGTLELRSPWKRSAQGTIDTLPTARSILNTARSSRHVSDDSSNSPLSNSPGSAGAEKTSGPLEDSGVRGNYSRRDHSPRRRSRYSGLPPVPTEADDAGSQIDSVNSSADFVLKVADELAFLEDDTSLFDEEHVYDVPSDVVAGAHSLDQDDCSLSQTIPSNSISDFTMWEGGSLAYQASGSGSCTESYFYNGSLYSQGTDGAESSLCYPDSNLSNRVFIYKSEDPHSILRQRFRNSKLPMIFMLDGKPFVFPGKKLNSETSTLEDQVGGLSVSDSYYDIDPLNSSIGSDYALRNLNLKVDEYDMNKIPAEAGLLRKDILLEFDSEIPPASVGVDPNSSSTLKVWDLRLATINLEQNQYSTFPLRKPTVDDLSLGHFTPGSDLGYQHDNDVSSVDHDIYKTQRYLRAPILTKYFEYSDFDLQSTCTTDLYSLNPYKNGGCHLTLAEESTGSWMYFSPDKNAEDFPASSATSDDNTEKLGRFTPFSDWPMIMDEPHQPMSPWSLQHEGKQPGTPTPCSKPDDDNSSDTVFSKLDSKFGHHGSRGHVDSILVRRNSKSSTRRASSVFESEEFIYGGSLCSSNSAYVGSPRYSRRSSLNSTRSSIDRAEGEALRAVESQAGHMKHLKPHIYDTRPVIWGDASVVDWRRQAELFKDKNFITLIL